MYHLYQGPHIRKLAEELSGLLNKNKPVNPFTPVEIIVPNRDTARWLSLALAEMEGITANISYKLPSEWLWERIREKHEELPDKLPSDPGPMSWSIYKLLGDRSILKRFPILEEWLDRQTDTTGIHRWELSKLISSVFDQYQVYRPEMIYSWGKEECDDFPSKWQADLWKILNEIWNRLEDKQLRFNRGELFRQVFDDHSKSKTKKNIPVYLFNTGLIPPPISKLLLQISRSIDVYNLAISSTAHTSLQENREIQNELAANFNIEQEEQVGIIKKFDKDYPGRIRYKKIEAGTLKNHHLGLIQKSIIDNEKTPQFEQSDGSIEIRSCHNPLRELEVLHQYLLQKFSDHDELSPDDILVVTPDINYYTPFIQAVFGVTEVGLPQIPFHIAGNTNKGSGIKPAFLDLMEISGSRFRKEQVIDFMHHSAVRERFQLSDADLSMIKQWFDENRVVWGLDGVHRSEFQQPDEVMQTWHHAFRRGWLGQLMVEKPGSVINGLLLYSGVSSADEKQLWAKVNRIIRYLARVKKTCRQKLNLSEWEAELKKWLEFLISDKPEYENERKFVTEAIEQAVKDAVIGQIRDKVHFSLIHNVLIEKLNNTSGISSFFTRGVLFNSMVPVRSLPFKIIVLLGLNDDQFPRQPVKPEFDLMNTQRKPGERDRKSEDRNLFLESVMSAEDVHYSSYIGRNQKDDEAVPPSPILDEWIHSVAKCYQTEPEECVRQERLNGFSTESFLKGSEESFSRKYMGLVKGLLTERNVNGLEVDIELSLPDHLLDGVINLDSLAAFYRNPAGSFFRNRLDIYLNGADDEEDEFRVDGLSNHILFQYIFGWLLKGKEKEWIREIMLLSGYLPEGWPGERKMNEIIRMAEYGIAQIRGSGYLPGRVRHDIDIRLDQYVLKGIVTSFSQKGMLDIHLSSESGRSMLLSWIRHLALCYETGDKGFGTEILYDLKKKEVKWKRFQYEPDAGKILRELIEIYFDGMKSPLNLYIDSAYVYATNIEKGESTALNYALNEWGGDYKMYPERSNRYIELLLGKEAEADREEIADISEKLYMPMIRNMENVS